MPMFKEYCDDLFKNPKKLNDFAPYPKAVDRNFWDNLQDFVKSVLIARGEDYINFDFPYISATDFMEFSRTGNRTNYEDKLFSKRLGLSSLVLAECVEHKGRFMDDIINGIYSICDEAAWFLPAHNSYIRDTPQLLLPDTTNPVIELFSCETGAILATVNYLLGNELDLISEFICKRINDNLYNRIITPYLNRHFWWMGNGDEPMCNWTIWCTQNVLLTSFLSNCCDKTTLRQIVGKSCESTDYFLKDYGNDGCCEEGAQYYRHAGLCLFQTLFILDKVTDGYFAPLWTNKKIQNIAEYILKVHAHDKYFINFADCSPIAGRCGAREYLFGKMTELKNLQLFAAKDFKADTEKFSPKENNLFYRLQEVFSYEEIMNCNTDDMIPHSNVYYESVGIYIVRNNKYILAAKTGDNDDSHNHNDTGSITVYKDGQPFIIDVGVESYTQKTFSPQRYEIWTMQSDYHNLPTINSCMEVNGPNYKATNVDYSIDKSNTYIEMDIKNAYPSTACINYYKRKVSLTDQGVFLTDNWDYIDNSSSPNQVILNFMTYEKPVLTNPDTITIGDLGSMVISGDKQIQIETIPITDKRLMTCWEHDIYRIRIHAATNNVEINFK